MINKHTHVIYELNCENNRQWIHCHQFHCTFQKLQFYKFQYYELK